MRRGLLAAAAAQIESFLLEPADGTRPGAVEAERHPSAPVVRPDTAPAAPSPPEPHPVIAVFGLSRRCGATVVARALAAELAARESDATAAVASRPRGGALSLATPAARGLAGVLADIPGADTAAVGCLCLVEGANRIALAEAARALAPLVIDAGTSELGEEPAAVADRVLLVSAPGGEPALATAAAACVRRLAGEPVIVLNRAQSNAARPEGVTVALPESRMGAQLALGGRQPRGELGRAVAALADLCVVTG